MNQIFTGDTSRRAFQFFSLFRYGTLLLMAIGLARIFPDQEAIANYERLLLLGGSLTFFWVSGLNDAFLVLFRRSTPPLQAALLLPSRRIHVAAATISALALPLLALILYPGQFHWTTLAAFAAFTAGDTYAMQVTYLWLAERRGRPLVIFALGSYALQAAALLLPILITGDLASGILSLGAFGLLKGLTAHFLLLRPTPSPNEAAPDLPRELLRLALPLMGAALISQSATYLDSYLVESFFPADFANFRYGAKELPLVLLLANALSISQSGDIATASQSQDLSPALRDLRRSARRLMHLLFPFSALLLLVSGPLFTLAFGADFAGAVPIFDIYLLLIIPRLLFPQSILRGLGLTRYLAMSAAYELGINVVLSIVGMWLWGIEGIAAATVVAFFVEKIILLGVVHRKVKVQMPHYTALIWWGGYSVGLLGLVLGKYLL